VEDFTINELLPALSKGSLERGRKEIAAKKARYSGSFRKLGNFLDAIIYGKLLRDQVL
jgi:hypothetical protein